MSRESKYTEPRRRVQQYLAIARTTFIETIEQPVALLILLSTCIITLLVPIFQFHRFSEDGRLARDSGLSALLVFGLVIAATSASKAIAGEIKNGTAAAALGKPVSRTTFFLAKWLGVVGALLIFWLGGVSATLLAERGSARFVSLENYAGHVTDYITLLLAFIGIALALAIAAIRHYRKHQRFGVTAFTGIALAQAGVVLISGFYNRLGELYPLHGEAACYCCSGVAAPSHAGNWFFYHHELNLALVPVALLILMALLIFAALACALATRLSAGITLAGCGAFLLLGLAGDALWVHAPWLSLQGIISGILPDIQNFWLCDVLARGGHVPGRYLWVALGYATTYCTLFLLGGSLAFQSRDIG